MPLVTQKELMRLYRRYEDDEDCEDKMMRMTGLSRGTIHDFIIDVSARDVSRILDSQFRGKPDRIKKNV